MMFQFEDEYADAAQIKVVGVGGAGGNAVNGMVTSGLPGVEFVAVNTDHQALAESQAHNKLQIGAKVTRGLGSGGDPRIGDKAMEEDEATVAEVLQGSDMVFVTAGMGGGTGTGASPTVARIARELGSLVVGIVTMPFSFEGRHRSYQAREGMERLKSEVDTLIAIENDRLLKIVPPNTPLIDAFRVADLVLYHATKGISDLITVPGLVNLDFADVRSIMTGMGDAIMGSGTAQGEGRAGEAAGQAISSPLLEQVDIRGARGVLVNITGGGDMTLHEVSEATSVIQEGVGADANLIFGAVIDPNAGDELRVTVIATGFGEEAAPSESRVRPEQLSHAAAAAIVRPAADWARAAAGSEPVRQSEPIQPAYPQPDPVHPLTAQPVSPHPSTPNPPAPNPPTPTPATLASARPRVPATPSPLSGAGSEPQAVPARTPSATANPVNPVGPPPAAHPPAEPVASPIPPPAPTASAAELPLRGLEAPAPMPPPAPVSPEAPKKVVGPGTRNSMFDAEPAPPYGPGEPAKPEGEAPAQGRGRDLDIPTFIRRTMD